MATKNINNPVKQKMLEFTLPVGTILKNGNNEYRIVEVLGAGGFGITYKVSSTIMVNNVPIMTFFAVKEHFMKGCERDTDGKTVRFAATMKSDVEASKEDFVIEAKRLNQLSGKSKNIVRVNEVFEENHTAYYVMQFLDGGELSNVIEKNGPLSEAQALNMIMPIATAVDIIHREHLLHLDIKPDNIVLMTSPIDGTQYPVLIDFGIAKHFSSNGKPTSAHSAKGASDGYAPMEQYANIDSFAPEMDVYALGASLFYFLTGKTPKKAFDITEEDVEKGLPDNVSKKTRKAIIGAMQPFRQNRTKSVKDFIEMLEESYTLSPGTVIKSPKFKYRIIGVAEETPYYIIYNALPAELDNKEDDSANSSSTRMLNSPSSRKGSQRKGTGENKNQNFRIFEMFVRNQFKRNEDGTVVGTSRSAEEEFDKVIKNEVPKNTMDKVENGIPLAEEFKANGTRYVAIVGPKKSSKILDVFSSISSTSGSLRKSQGGKSNKLIWYIAGGVVALALIAWIILGAIGGKDEGNTPEKQPTETVQEPVNQNENKDDSKNEQQENKQDEKIEDNATNQTNTQPAQQPEVPADEEIVKPELPKNVNNDAKKKEEEVAKKKEAEKKAREAEAKRQAEQAAKKKAADEAAAAARKKAADDAAAAAARKKAAEEAALAAAKKKAADDAAAAAAAAKKKADDEAAAKKKAEYEARVAAQKKAEEERKKQEYLDRINNAKKN